MEHLVQRKATGGTVTWDFPRGVIGSVHLLTSLTGVGADSVVIQALLRRGLARRGVGPC